MRYPNSFRTAAITQNQYVLVLIKCITCIWKKPSSLKYNSWWWSTLWKLWVWYEFALTVALPGKTILSMVCVVLPKWEEMHQKAFQGAGMSSCCIYPLLVLPLLSRWGSWVTYYSSSQITLALFLSYLRHPYQSFFVLFIIFAPSLHLSLLLHLPLGLLLGIPSVPEGWAKFESHSLG